MTSGRADRSLNGCWIDDFGDDLKGNRLRFNLIRRGMRCLWRAGANILGLTRKGGEERVLAGWLSFALPGSILEASLEASFEARQDESLNIATRILVVTNANKFPYANQENLDL